MTPKDNVDVEFVSDVIDKVITIYDNDTDEGSGSGDNINSMTSIL